MTDNSLNHEGRWEVHVDTGGTFTDCLAQDPSGLEHRVKVLSSGALRGRIIEWEGDRRFRFEAAWSGPDDFVRGFGFRSLSRNCSVVKVAAYHSATRVMELIKTPDEGVGNQEFFELLSQEEAPLLAARLFTATPAGAPLPPLSMRLATTRGTNALLTRSGTPPVLFITQGFGDILEIGNQARPDLFALNVEKPRPLYAMTVELAGRLDADGAVIVPFDLKKVETDAAGLVQKGHRSAAVALLHADKRPDCEHEVAATLKQAGFEHVSCSADLAPFIKILMRAETAVVNAYLAPAIDSYLSRISTVLRDGSLLVMTSAGGLVRADSYQAKDSLLSGPAGGISGAVSAGRSEGLSHLIAFDMGGTSTDVARYDGDFEYVFEHTVGDAHLAAPALAIESVAAGGGSICDCDGMRLVVGPKSAGAHPGPACYGALGPLTVTDVNLLAGRIDPDRFEIPIVPEAAERALVDVSDRLAAATDEKPEKEQLIEGFLEIANQRMADAIRRISLRLGYDPSNYTLVAFGGAGPQHALAVAERLGVQTVLIPAHPGLLSAQGLAGAAVERFAERQILRPLDEIQNEIPRILDGLVHEATDRLAEEGINPDDAIVRRCIAGLRFVGQDATLEVDVQPEISLDRVFEEQYVQIFGHQPESRAVELVSLRVVASTIKDTEIRTDGPVQVHEPTPHGTARALFAGRWVDVASYDRNRLLPGARFNGPALVFERYSATVIEPGWRVVVSASRSILAHRVESHQVSKSLSQPESVRLELFTHRFETIAREMGESLRRTAVSTNIKERLDFSCALVDTSGELIVNAPHMPVHLGSLGLCVRRVVQEMPIDSGDTVITNHPDFGGSHLPDITLISPAHGSGGSLIGYAVSRAHHAEIGGALPGSMPPTATRLIEEGVVIRPTYLVRQGEAQWDSIRQIIQGGPYPSRAPEDNLADLRAALAANMSGVTALRKLADTWGEDTLAHYMTALKDRAEASIRAALSRIKDGPLRAQEVLDDGTVLAIQIKIRGDQVHVDFSGSSGVHPGNLNATPAVVLSTWLYVLRLLIDEPLPLNEGLLRSCRMRIPTGILNPRFGDDPAEAPAVVGGNVETSQRLVNGLIRAFGLTASSQGTMNNLLFGNDDLSYYETVCGGCGAGPGFHGASAVHSHMTNTRITDPEVIEHRYPVRLKRFQVRRSSGGAGRFKGGDGVIREFEFLKPMTLSILSQHRIDGPMGINGGKPGQFGSQRVVRATGEEQILGSIDTCEVGPGDCLILKTPGGGGYGSE
ncbi:MAG: 5-oxoprolinase [Proteobacteria bacterium]|nr:5-oxoprolinase [Pseudomonadota bacterium]